LKVWGVLLFWQMVLAGKRKRGNRKGGREGERRKGGKGKREKRKERATGD
jgi:hypothetical protein